MAHGLGAAFDRRALLAGASSLAAIGALGRGTAAGAAETPFATEIAPGVHVHQGQYAVYTPQNEGDVSNSGFIVGRDAVAVIDTGGTEHVGARLRDAIRAVTSLPIRYVINTHMHPDHVLGNAAFEADQPAFVGHYKLERGLSARADRYLSINQQLAGAAAFAGTKVVPPTMPIHEETTLDLGGREIVLSPQKTAHTDNDLVVRDKDTSTMFLGDLLFSVHVPSLDGSILGWIAVVEALAQQSAARVVPGHGPPSMPWPEASKPLLKYLVTLRDEIRALIKQNRTLTEAMTTVGRSEKDAWKLFDAYHARNVSAAFAELEWE